MKTLTNIVGNSAILACLLGGIAPLHAEVRLPAILGSGMVLQQGRDLAIWGWADPGEKVTVAFAGQTQSAVTRPNGSWQVRLAAISASKEGRSLEVTGKTNTVRLDDVLVGEVWICSGQSNMQLALKDSKDGRAAAGKANHPAIRLFTVELAATVQPRQDCEGRWQASTPASAGPFSAVGYYFGSKLHEDLDVPVGLINTSWGGQNIDYFLPRVTLADAAGWSKGLAARIDRDVQNHKPEESKRKYDEAIAKWDQAMERFKQAKSEGSAKGSAPKKPTPPDKVVGPSRIYNAMIAPLVSLGIRGVIWYQGEANRREGMLYAEKMESLISGWRKVWNQGDFPFLFVQLAPCKYFGTRASGDAPMGPPSAESRPCQILPVVWQAQRETLKIPQTGMAVTVDLDGPALHPARKREVGERLATWALANTYGKKGLVYSGPLFKSAKEEGDSLRISFDHSGSGLASRDGKDLDWFEIAGSDKVYYPANARIDGSELIVSSGDVSAPKYVRYGWDEIAMPNLMNKEGLPASPFTSELLK